MTENVASGDWCYYCKTYRSAHLIAYQLFTNNELKSVCQDCELAEIKKGMAELRQLFGKESV